MKQILRFKGLNINSIYGVFILVKLPSVTLKCPVGSERDSVGQQVLQLIPSHRLGLQPFAAIGTVPPAAVNLLLQ